MATALHFCLLGDPVDHSKSPQIHRAALEELGIAGDYVAIRSGPAELARSVEDLRKGVLTGINITMPLKGAAAEACDTLTEDAAASGSVNTLRARSGSVEGESTDVLAARDVLSRQEFDQSAPLLVLGAGGAAAAILQAARGREAYIAARDIAKAGLLAGSDRGVITFGTGVAGSVVINATPLGMHGEQLPHNVLEPAAALLDLAYGPDTTPAVAAAQEMGTPVVDGLEFLAAQAAYSFEWWTGLRAPLDAMVAAARKH